MNGDDRAADEARLTAENGWYPARITEGSDWCVEIQIPPDADTGPIMRLLTEWQGRAQISRTASSDALVLTIRPPGHTAG
ncbi:hypothetical protein BIV57_10775 [Mangrovactinospora gilvigrisea]|uniref:Uncharacterized protein n=1 Tax=Mangrovactinospora gilvigrisea TaxID=1428644 RepID=A0A1J7C7D8_9ACTN|nr:hypothetical protein [Mangrovactinospora gilvigrisea]OIV37444.1 hypothetical protein BIV57_10775 [Mangrovactinospora gilvigrisea]